MKMRIVLASMVALLLSTWVGVLPAEAASRDQDRVTVVYRGYNVSWSSSDPSDFRVDRTPGRAEQFPKHCVAQKHQARQVSSCGAGKHLDVGRCRLVHRGSRQVRIGRLRSCLRYP